MMFYYEIIKKVIQKNILNSLFNFIGSIQTKLFGTEFF